jgi:DNA-binding NarL/FixJ family response regulator
VVVADARPEARAARSQVLGDAGWLVLAEAVDAPESRALVRRLHPLVLVLDGLLDGDGVELVRDIRDGDLAECVVVGRRRCRCQALTFIVAGAAGFLSEDDSDQRLVETVQRVSRGEAGLPPRLVRELVDDVRRRDHEDAFHHCGTLSTLTPRQWEVLDLMREGLSTQQMARRLVVAPVTVRSHVARVLHVLGARDRVEALEKLDSLLALSARDRAEPARRFAAFGR